MTETIHVRFTEAELRHKIWYDADGWHVEPKELRERLEREALEDQEGHP